jgi:hypothetical protein
MIVMNAVVLVMLVAVQVAKTPDCSAPVWGDELARFNTRVSAYAELRSQLEKGLPSRTGLAQQIRVARSKAKQGDIFTPAISVEFKKALAREMDAHVWKILTDDDNPGELLTQVNASYPMGKPLSTMPPNILAALPTLPPDLEYRFVERHLILLDTRAKLILDRIPYAIRYADGDTPCR